MKTPEYLTDLSEIISINDRIIRTKKSCSH